MCCRLTPNAVRANGFELRRGLALSACIKEVSTGGATKEMKSDSFKKHTECSEEHDSFD
jgi:hypothetical protein